MSTHLDVKAQHPEKERDLPLGLALEQIRMGIDGQAPGLQLGRKLVQLVNR